jgi:hypothetical protein
MSLEQQAHDWRPAASCPWMAEVLEETAGCEVVHYMLGLGHWQRNNHEAAVTSFARCWRGKPPVLNPAAYYLCLHLDDPHRAAGAWTELQQAYSIRDLARCRAMLQNKLASWREAAWLKVLGALGTQDEGV